jgi:hypothetical protein
MACLLLYIGFQPDMREVIHFDKSAEKAKLDVSFRGRLSVLNAFSLRLP